MKNQLFKMSFALNKVEPRHLKLALLTFTLVCLVIGAGAPAGTGH